MLKYTPSWISRGILSGPRGWLSLVLVVSLVCGLNFPLGATHGRDGVWWPEIGGGWPWLRPSRIGRWVWRACRLVQASGLRLVCRVGLVAVLVEASGLPQHRPATWLLVGLPAMDWGLSLIGVLWPRLLSQAWYREGLNDMHQLYRWSVIGLLVLTAQRGSKMGPVGMVMGSVVTCERDGSRVEIERVEGVNGQVTYRIHQTGDFTQEVTPRDEFEKRQLILELRRLRTGGRGARGWGVVTQEALAQAFQVTQEEISRWEKYQREGQWAKLLSLNPKSWLSDDLRQHIVEVWATNIWQPADQVRQRLAERGVKVALRVVEDEHGQRQTVEVYRYYCKNPDCPYKTFTNLPPGRVAHSVWTLDARLRALELYAGLHTTYRGAAAALGVSPSTLYHWLARFGDRPLQVAALFGMVRSSGVVGIDEKYVKVPKNSKPESKQRKWMYVYVAVDVHTLDLLHINIFPNLGKDSARTFLLELRAKGYHPRVIITDMNQDYSEPLAAVFPQATHHECVFHALQYWPGSFKRVFGRDYDQSHPDLFKLRQQIDHIFQAKARRTVQTRYDQLMARRTQLVQAEPRLEPILDSLQRHYPLLLNAYGNPLIPLTNNATERLIRRFDQHYQNFAGFDSLETARCYLYLFELAYRFTPFGQEVQPHLRGKCPLELAGYDLTQVPLARYLREHGQVPLIPTQPEVVPK